MPRQIVRRRTVEDWISREGRGLPTQGDRVRWGGDPTHIGEIVHVFTRGGTRLAVVQWDTPRHYVPIPDAGYPETEDGGRTLRYEVIHPGHLEYRLTRETMEAIDAPVCDECGATDAVGETGQDRALCDECAVDLDVPIAMWETIEVALAAIEEEAEEAQPARRRRRERGVPFTPPETTEAELSPRMAEELAEEVYAAASEVEGWSLALEDAEDQQRAERVARLAENTYTIGSYQFERMPESYYVPESYYTITSSGTTNFLDITET